MAYGYSGNEKLCACGCGKVVKQNGGQGRTRYFFSGACKQRDYRGRKTACTFCGRQNVFSLKPWSGAWIHCFTCNAEWIYSNGEWKLRKKGKLPDPAAASEQKMAVGHHAEVLWKRAGGRKVTSRRAEELRKEKGGRKK